MGPNCDQNEIFDDAVLKNVMNEYAYTAACCINNNSTPTPLTREQKLEAENRALKEQLKIANEMLCVEMRLNCKLKKEISDAICNYNSANRAAEIEKLIKEQEEALSKLEDTINQGCIASVEELKKHNIFNKEEE